MPDIMVRNKHGFKKTSFPWCNTPLIPLSPSSTMIPSGERGGRAGQGLDGDGPGGFLRGTTQHVFFVPTKRDKKKSNHQFLFQLIGSGVWTMCQRSLILCSSLGLCIGPAVLPQGDFCTVMHESAMPALNNTEIPVFDGLANMLWSILLFLSNLFSNHQIMGHRCS